MSDRQLLFILTNRNSDRILLLRTGKGWVLPAYDDAVAENVGFDNAGPFNDWFGSRFGIDVVRRYALDFEGVDPVVFVLECRVDDPAIPAEGQWVGPEEVHGISFARSDQRALSLAWSADTHESATMPWSRQRGYDEAFAWVAEKLGKLGMAITGPPEQVKNAYVSTVFRWPTEGGIVYLKILPSVFVREGQVMARLAQWGIAELPERLATDLGRGLILMKDMGGRDLAESHDIDSLCAVVRAFAGIQIASIPFIDVRNPRPFHDWRVGVLASRIDGIVEELPALLRNSPYQLTEEEAVQLRGRLPEWKGLCAEIEDAGIPDTIDHGDLRPGNIRAVGERLIFYDWAWSAITHPFIAIAGLLHNTRKLLPEAERARDILRDAYLEAWAPYADGQALRPLFEQVAKAGTLYGVVADAEWLRAINTALGGRVPGAASADAWTVCRRQYYLAKMVRRLL